MKKKIIAYNRVDKTVLEKLKKEYDAKFFKNIDTINDPDFYSI